jgi:4-hydroxybenzoate polyprenyltransferase
MLYANFFVLLLLCNSIYRNEIFIDFFTLLISYIFIGIAGFLLNDFFDAEPDRIARKNNITLKYKPIYVAIVIFILILSGLALSSIISISIVYLLLVQLALLIAYSVKYIRLKERGFWGILTDATYAHLIPEIILLILINKYSNQIFVPVFFLLMSFSIGLRDILIHQLKDYENDKKSNTKTYVSSRPTKASSYIDMLNIAIAAFILLFVFELYWVTNIKYMLILSGTLGITYLYIILIDTNEHLNDAYIRAYIICTSLLLGFMLNQSKLFIGLVFLLHPYILSFLSRNAQALYIKIK